MGLFTVRLRQQHRMVPYTIVCAGEDARIHAWTLKQSQAESGSLFQEQLQSAFIPLPQETETFR